MGRSAYVSCQNAIVEAAAILWYRAWPGADAWRQGGMPLTDSVPSVLLVRAAGHTLTTAARRATPPPRRIPRS